MKPTRLALVALCWVGVGALASGQTQLSSYRSAAQDYREAAAKAPADRRPCYLAWANYYDGVANALLGGPMPAEPRMDPGCEGGGSDALSSGPAGSGAGLGLGGFGAFGSAPAQGGVGGALTAGLGALQNVVAQRVAANRQMWANADAEHNRRENAYHAAATEAGGDLWVAAAEGEDDRVLKMLLQGTRPDAMDDNDGTPLQHARDPWTMRLLLQHGAAVDAEDSWGFTAFNRAVEHGNFQEALVLLSYGANANHVPYHPSFQKDATGALRTYHDLGRLVQYVNKPDPDFKARLTNLNVPSAAADEINRAAARGEMRALVSLVQSGVAVDSGDATSFTPLQNAIVYSSSPDAVRTLIELGANVNAANAFGQTALMLAARKMALLKRLDPLALDIEGSKQAVDLLLGAGADKAVHDFADLTALDYFLRDSADDNKTPSARLLATLLTPPGRR